MRACLGLAGLLLVKTQAYAQAPDAAQAQLFEQQIHQSLANLAGPKTNLPARPVELTPSGDHYRIDIPFAPLLDSVGQHVDGLGTASGVLKPLDHGRWAIDDLALPMPSHFTVAAGPPDKPVTVSVDLDLHQQSSHLLFDPAFVSPWSFASGIGASDIHILRPDGEQRQHLEAATAHGALAPAADGRLDLTEDAELRAISTRTTLPNGQIVRFATDRAAFALHLDRLDRGHWLEAFTILDAARRAQSLANQPQAQKAMLHSLILALRAAAGGGGLTESADGLDGEASGHPFSVRHIELSLGVDAPADMLDARVRLAIDGLASPDIPPPMLPYVPTRVTLQPYVSGISVADLTRMALDATAPDPAPPPDPSSLFSHGGLVGGIDALSVEVGGTAITGKGELTARSPADVSGHARLAATGFDDFMKTVQADPLLGPQALPVLLLIRGLAKSDSDSLIWEILYEGGRVKVNGTDLSAMLGK